MGKESLGEIYTTFQWFFSLGYVSAIAIVVTLLMVSLMKKTILRNILAQATSTQKDSVLGFVGLATACVSFVLLHFVNEMIIQGKFMIDFNAVTQGISIPSGATFVWTGSKSVYTALHQKFNKAKTENTETKTEDANMATIDKKAKKAEKQAAKAEKKNAKALFKAAAKRDKERAKKAKKKQKNSKNSAATTEKKVVNLRTNGGGQ